MANDDAERKRRGERPKTAGAAPSSFSYLMWNVAGTLFLCLGVIGVALPLVPTTPFLLVAAACYAKGSPRMYRWMTTNRYFGAYLKNYWEGRGIPLRAKVASVAFLWAVIGLSAAFATDDFVIRVVLFAIATIVSVHIMTIRKR